MNRTKNHNGATLETTRIDHAKIIDIRMDCNGTRLQNATSNTTEKG